MTQVQKRPSLPTRRLLNNWPTSGKKRETGHLSKLSVFKLKPRLSMNEDFLLSRASYSYRFVSSRRHCQSAITFQPKRFLRKQSSWLSSLVQGHLIFSFPNMASSNSASLALLERSATRKSTRNARNIEEYSENSTERASQHELRSVNNPFIVNISTNNEDRQFSFQETEFYEFDCFLFDSWDKKRNGRAKNSISWGHANE